MMEKFHSVLLVSPIPGGREWVVREPFTYTTQVSFENSQIGRDIVVSERFVTDFASIPRAFWFFLPRWGKYGNAAVVHDYLYWVQKTTREEADLVMKEAMIDLGVSDLVIFMIFNAVRIGGRMGWRRNKVDKLDPSYSRIMTVEDYENLVGEDEKYLNIEELQEYKQRPPMRKSIFKGIQQEIPDIDSDLDLGKS